MKKNIPKIRNTVVQSMNKRHSSADKFRDRRKRRPKDFKNTDEDIKQFKLSCEYKKTSDHIQPEEYYIEGNMMSDGWGDYMYSIDKLRESVENKEPITLKDALWICYAESLVMSSKFEFIKEKIKEAKLDNISMPWEFWKPICLEIVKNYDDKK